ncbi:MAG: hypothetical protein IJM92_17515 [Fibrobacter sp.]|uniref:hypothetical protein n=1 Tax=Fibrobacter sp. TaxID=35828 RepID=UPI0025B999B2|nr:hypothetical protein [Fibrobacter sp.]MBQ7081417.1 hypothetical protein [Fibrobacter sp.]
MIAENSLSAADDRAFFMCTVCCKRNFYELLTLFVFVYDFVFANLFKIVVFCTGFSLKEENDEKNTLLAAILIWKKRKVVVFFCCCNFIVCKRYFVKIK